MPLENIFQLRELLKSKGRLEMKFSEPISPKDIMDELGDSDIKTKRLFADKLHAFLYQMDEDHLSFSKFNQ